MFYLLYLVSELTVGEHLRIYYLLYFLFFVSFLFVGSLDKHRGLGLVVLS